VRGSLTRRRHSSSVELSLGFRGVSGAIGEGFYTTHRLFSYLRPGPKLSMISP
jgi:hypothetical protein